MALPDTSIDPRILDSAKQEFLAHGFVKTQLKDICREAGVTTGALYKRYQGKEDLFCALVEDAARDITQAAQVREAQDPALLTDAQLLGAWGMEENSDYSWSMEAWFDFLYARKEEFTLLLACAEGTRYSGFTDRWLDRMTEGTYRYLQEICRRGMADRPVTKEELRVILGAFWAMVREPFLQNFDRQQLDVHCGIMCRMFNWQEILGLHMPG